VSQLGIALLTIAISTFAGVFGWVAINFFAEPLLSFHKRRRAIRETMLYAANVDVKRRDAFDATYEELRRHAAAMDALDETVPRAVKTLIGWQGFNMPEAKTGLIGFSNSLATYEDSREKARNRIRKALRFRGEF
jgi:hypothetical protein